ncbi:hypothetical protein FLL45_21570 [Aliikangiella marina]|uniref:Uncharacterized protein n=1 Tax=Aliikangiella marina TaxID=1712262 RepID=A0A545T149_9GAMM|nr:hypothetical protein [Aliikangiella marina]TQV70919.1 hypothetical protein FLL45_21570 [Aliikangiella marina]
MQTQEENLPDNPYESPKSQVSNASEDPAIYQGKVYNGFAVAIATLFGSVLAAGLVLHSNFTHFNKNLQAGITVVFTIIATIVFLFASLFVKYPSSLMYLTFNFVLAIIVFPLTIILQGAELDEHEEADLPFHSVFRAAMIGIACLFAMGMMLVFAYTMFIMSQP